MQWTHLNELPSIPGFTFLAELTHEFHGIVYHARRGTRDFAIKMPPTQGLNLDPTTFANFQREASTLALVRHPNLPKVYTINHINGVPYSVMEYLQGTLLVDILAEEHLSEARVVKIAKVLTSTLAAVHRQGVIHCDIQPRNILITNANTVKLLDFGFATSSSNDANVGHISGALRYTAPEQTGYLRRPIDARSDLYALGAVLFECLTGLPPFVANDTNELLHLHATTPAPDVRSLNPRVSAALALIIDRLLAKEPNERYQTAEGLLSDLEDLDAFNESIKTGNIPILDNTDGWTSALYEEPLIGRDRELALLRQAWNKARNAQGSFTMIEGAMGLGKSHLGRELCHRARSIGGLVLMARCSEEQAQPYSVVRSLIGQYLRQLALLPETQRSHAMMRIQHIIAPYAQTIVRLIPELIPFAAKHTPSEIVQHENITPIVADVLLWMTRVHPAAVIFIDDIQRIDEASLLVIGHILAAMQQSPLLIIATVGEENGQNAIIERLSSNHPIPIQRIHLQPLEKPLVERLISVCLGGYKVDPAIIREITVRSGGSPFAIREYIQALLATNKLWLIEERWVIEPADLEAMQLPSHVVSLVLNRVDDLMTTTRHVLSIAAILGFQFRRDTLIQVLQGDIQQVDAALDHATQAHLIERMASGDYQFSHHNVHQTLLSKIDETQRQTIHLQVAQTLDQPTVKPERLYELAYHYYSAHSSDRNILQHTYDLLLRVTDYATHHYAYAQAYEYFGYAHELAQLLNVVFPPRHHAMFAEVCIQRGLINEALEHLNKAQQSTTDPFEQAGLKLKQISLQEADSNEIWATFEQICTDLGQNFDFSRAGAWRDIADSIMKLVGLRLGFGRAISADERPRLRILASLYSRLSYYSFTHGYSSLTVAAFLRFLLIARRLGLSHELVHATNRLVLGWNALNYPERAKHYLHAAQTMANQLDSRMARADVAIHQGYLLSLLGQHRESSNQQIATLTTYEPYLTVIEYAQVCSDLVTTLYFRGYLNEAWQWTQRGLQRIDQSNRHSIEHASLYSMVKPLVIILNESDTNPFFAQPQINVVNVSKLWRSLVYFGQLLVALEQADYSDNHEAQINQLLSLRGFNRRMLFAYSQYTLIPILYLRLAQAQQATAIKRIAALRRLGKTLHLNKPFCRLPLVNGHSLVVEAGYEYLCGNLNRALELLAHAEALAHSIDAPWILYEAARIRSYTLWRMGQQIQSQREALRAQQLAHDYAWISRQRRISQEFNLDDAPATLESASSISGDVHRPDMLKLQRHLEALMRVSLGWANVFNPEQQMQLVLDSVIRILGAERALLFMLKNDALNLYAGRDTQGNDIDKKTNDYSLNVVVQVFSFKKPIVISHASDLAKTGTSHPKNARSILAAPLLLDNRCLGVIYLDNSLAWGFFSQDDVEILQAIANHIILGLETARTTQLEFRINAEQEQRRLAEAMRHTATILNSTLDLPTVLEESLSTIASFIPYDSASIALVENDIFQFVALKGINNANILKNAKIHLAEDELFNEMSRTFQPIIVNDTLLDPRFKGYGENLTRAWMGVPLIMQNYIVGFMGIDRNEPNSITGRDAEIAKTFAAQASIAISNARMFGELQRLAITDGLTDVYNRRHFFELATNAWDQAHEYDHPVSALMIDIDYFKNVNDGYTHQTGDVVLHTIAQTCRENLRETDILGRYGGEEFVVLLPDTDVSAAYTIAERLRTAIENLVFQTQYGNLKVTASIGVAGATQEMIKVEQLINRADNGLYIAKEAGRNRVTMA